MPDIDQFPPRKVGCSHPIWQAITHRDDALVRQLLHSDCDIDLNSKDQYGRTLLSELERGGWFGKIFASDVGFMQKHRIPSLFFKKILTLGLSHEELLCEALLRRGFLVFQDQDGVWLGTGSHPDDLIILEMVIGISVAKVSDDSDRLARVSFTCSWVDQMRVVEFILSIPQNPGMMGGRAYKLDYKGYRWLSYCNTVWGTQLSVCPSTYLGKHLRLGYDALDTGIALLVKAWPLARVSTAFGSCDGHGGSTCYLGFATDWDTAWAKAVFKAINMPTPGSVWFDQDPSKIESIDGKDDDEAILALMEDIQRFARILMQREVIRMIGKARAATLKVFGAKAPTIKNFQQEAQMQLERVALNLHALWSAPRRYGENQKYRYTVGQ